jgi:predicted O-methyltransferase YrrM
MIKLNDRLNALTKGINYFITSGHTKGHGIHSPFVYEFAQKVLFDNNRYSDYSLIENLIAEIYTNKEAIAFDEHGAGSHVFNNVERRICDIARRAGTSKKAGRLLYRMAHFYKPAIIIELGTSIGLSTFYLSKGAGNNAWLHTVEANKELSEMAIRYSEQINCSNCKFHTALFDKILPELIAEIKTTALVSIDGNHTYKATLNYFNAFNSAIDKGFIVIHDIYWSHGMEKAWKQIRKLSLVTIDLYSLGIVIKGDMLTPKHYTIRF